MRPRPADSVPRRDPRVSDAIEALQNGDDALRNGRKREALERFNDALVMIQTLLRETL